MPGHNALWRMDTSVSRNYTRSPARPSASRSRQRSSSMARGSSPFLLTLALVLLPSSQSLLAGPWSVRHFASRAPSAVVVMQSAGTIKSPRLAIEYCTRCNWMLRSAWTAQELLTTFNGTVGEVALVPNHEGDGTFDVTLLTSQGELRIWSRADEGRFPESKELKSLVRDAIDPGKDLGHSEAPSRNSGTTAFSRLVSGGNRSS